MHSTHEDEKESNMKQFNHIGDRIADKSSQPDERTVRDWMGPAAFEHYRSDQQASLPSESSAYGCPPARISEVCADRGYTRNRLDVIDTPRTYRGELPPRALDWRTVCKLLHSIDRSSVEGCRDHAILYLMAYYGLRPPEVAGLTLDSIDWENNTLRVDQCKTRSVLILPLNGRTRSCA
jgi:integrase